jgi:formate-dependent nitrite reductase membrane component NrfD
VLPVHLNITVMLTGYLLVMGYLGLGLLTLRRRPAKSWTPAQRLTPAPVRRGWPALVRQVVGTAIGGYLVLMAVVVGWYQGIARLGGGFLMSAVTGTALLTGVTLPLFFLASWVASRRRG